MSDPLSEAAQSANDTPVPASQLILDTLHLDDLPALMEIEERSFSAPWSEATYRHELTANAMAFYYVIRPPKGEVESGAKSVEASTHINVLAYGGFWLAGDEAHIVTIASHHELRGRRLGETMLLFLLQQAQSLGASTATLEVRPSNLAALGLYRKWGFEEVGRRKAYYRDNLEDALIYTLEGLDNPMTYLPIVLALGINVTSPELPANDQ